jgi:PAS domain S-box-containing protein
MKDSDKLKPQNEAKNVEEALRKSEERFRALITATTQIVWTTNAKGELIEDLPVWREFTGQSFEEIKGSGWANAVHPDDREQVMAAWSKAVGTRSLYEIEYRVRRHDGEYHYFSVRGVPVMEKDGTIREWVGVTNDIDERKKTEKISRESETLHRALIETTGTGYVIINTEGKVIDANQEYIRFTGHDDLNEIRGRSVVEWTADYEKKKNAEAVAQCAKDGYIRNLEIDYVDKRGNITPIEINATVVGIGGVPQILSLCRNITERRQAEEALRKSEARYRSYLEVSGQIGWTTPPDGVVDDIPEWRKYTGQSIEEVKGWGWLNAMHPDDRKRTTEVWNKAVATKSLYETEYRIRRKDGVYRYFLARGIPSLREDGTIREWVGVCIDITERKEMEENLQKLNQELEKRVEERTAELAASEHRFRDLAESLPQLVWTCLADGPCDYLGRQWVEYTGIPEAEQLNYGWLQQLHPDDRQPTISAWQEAVGKGKFFDVEFRIRRHDGVYRWFKTRAIPLHNTAGKVVKWFGSNTDIEDLKQMQQELKNRMAELEKFNEFAVDRELVMAELKKKIETLEKRLAEKSKER